MAQMLCLTATSIIALRNNTASKKQWVGGMVIIQIPLWRFFHHNSEYTLTFKESPAFLAHRILVFWDDSGT